MKYYVLEMSYGIPTMVREDSDLVKNSNRWVVKILFRGSEDECKIVLQNLAETEEQKEIQRGKEKKFLPRLARNFKLIKEMIKEEIRL